MTSTSGYGGVSGTAAVNVLKTDFSNPDSVSKGSALIGHIPPIGASVRTVREKLGDVYSVLDFGLVGDGVFDNTSALNGMIATLGSSITAGIIYFPPGVYKVNGEIGIGYSNMNFQGAGKGASVIVQHSTFSHTLHFQNIGRGCAYNTVQDLRIQRGPGVPTGGAAIFLEGANFCSVARVDIDGCFDSIKVSGGSLNHFADFSVVNARNTAILITNKTIDVFFTHGAIYSSSFAFPQLASIRIEDHVEAVNMTDVEVVGGMRPLYIESSSFGAGSRPAYNKFTNCYFDESTNGSYVNNIALTNFHNCWFSGGHQGPGNGLTIGQSNSLNFNGCNFFNCGVIGCLVNALSVRTRFIDCNFQNNGVSVGPGSAGLALAANTGNLTVQSCTFSNDVYFASQSYGLIIAAGTSNNLTIMGNDFVGGGTVAGFSDNSGGAQKFIGNNRV